MTSQFASSLAASGRFSGLRRAVQAGPLESVHRIFEPHREEKSAQWANNIETWVNKQVIGKLTKYLTARQYMPGYEDAPIGLRFTEKITDPSFRTAIEAAVAQFRTEHPDVTILLDFQQ